MMMEKTLCKSMDGSLGRYTVCKEHKCICRVSVAVTTVLPFHDGSSPIKLPPVACGPAWGMEPYQGSVVLSAVSRLATRDWPDLSWLWGLEVHVAEPMHNLCACNHGHIVHKPIGQ